MDESENKGDRCKKGKQYSGQIIIDSYTNRSNYQQTTDKHEDK